MTQPTAAEPRPRHADAPSISVVIPCLDEQDAIAIVVRKALDGIAATGLEGEVIVVDNASEDRSAELAAEAGARVVHEPRRGYGSAYLAGLAAARGRYIVLGDADDTYDFTQLGDLVRLLQDGADLALGSRLKGEILPGAMSWSHRWIGNPFLTGMLNLLFRARVSDTLCGLRALRRDALPVLNLSTIGMEFAHEMVIKAAKLGLRIEETPIVYHPRRGRSKLNSLRDAWRYFRFMLVYSPTTLFLLPGGLAIVAGLGVLVYGAVDRTLPDWGTPLAVGGAVAAILGVQLVQLGLAARTYAVLYLGDDGPTLERIWRRFQLEHGLALSALVAVAGVAITLVAYFDGVRDPRLGVLGLTLVALGVQGVFGSFFLSILGLSEHAIVRRSQRRDHASYQH